MIIPLGTDRPSLRPMLVTPLLIGLNVMVFVALAAVAARNPDQAEAIRGPLLLDPHAFKWYQPLTSAFLHAGFWHIAGNMLFLWVFGPNIEDRLGRLWFLLFYVGGAYAAGGLHALFEDARALGASGAVSACTGAYLVLFPKTQIKALFLLFLRPFSVSAWWFIAGAFVWDLIGHGSGRGGIAYLAHIGGSVYGASLMMILLWLKVLPREVFDLFSIARQANRRRQLKEATADSERQARQWWGTTNKPGVVSGEALAHARAEVSRLITAGDLPGAGKAYRALVTAHGAVPGAAVLSHRALEQLAAYFFQAPDDPAQPGEVRRAAAYVMERIIEAYPRESTTPRFRVLLAIVLSRDLNDKPRAKRLLEEAMPDLHDDSERATARAELELLNRSPSVVV
ncbi:MAG TPA: rhomboid family intramembrane serine protease [Phycisphaerales bacterium]|nr:rhomboid family intramembrane serine protease [Phycisphaerales bacterium]